MAQRFAVRVMVTDVWGQVLLAVEPTTTVAERKRQALELRHGGRGLDRR